MGDPRGAMQRELYAGISFMEQEGIVDERFIMAYQLKERSGPRYFVETIPLFCTNTEASIALMTDLMQLPILDYYSLDQHCIKIRGSSSCLGIHKLAVASKDLRDACKAANRPQCAYVFENLKREYYNFKEKVTPILKLECRIIALEGNGPQPAAAGTSTAGGSGAMPS
ncbi:hypothetical protein MLD38_024242 [Melastoma candidum]|uniref:Uncharacterized protein n=1 Tax=Melastoma candidum TaxID=119954 RepID=A0ACB9NTE1_9MYRT|nr:hypothetical protein MLD38_024242 [Melastoma candidum]